MEKRLKERKLTQHTHGSKGTVDSSKALSMTSVKDSENQIKMALSKTKDSADLKGRKKIDSSATKEIIQQHVNVQTTHNIKQFNKAVNKTADTLAVTQLKSEERVKDSKSIHSLEKSVKLAAQAKKLTLSASEQENIDSKSEAIGKRVTRSTALTSTAASSLLKKKDFVNKEGPLSLNAPTLANVKLLIMNANGKDDKGGTPEDRRKNAISNIINKHRPDIVLFQEFSWAGINGKTWNKWPIPDNYENKGHYDASIMIDSEHIVVQDLPANDIDIILSDLQRTPNNRLKQDFPTDFKPVPRICLTRIMAKTKPALDFICFSWHGKWRMSQLRKIEFFEYFMEFLRHLKEKYKIAMLVGGDFNIDMYSIEHLVLPPFKLCVYEASMRRTIKGIYDYYIVSEEIALEDIQWVNLERKTTVFRPNGILDHDPVLATLKPSLEAERSAALGSRKFPSPIKRSTRL